MVSKCDIHKLGVLQSFLSTESESRSVIPNSLLPHGLYSPWNSSGQNSGVGSLSLLQGIFSAQGSNPGLSHNGSPFDPLDGYKTDLNDMILKAKTFIFSSLT